MKKTLFFFSFLLFALQQISFAADFKVTHCSSLEKVFIKGERGGFAGYSSWPVKIQLAENEHEGFQLIVNAESGKLTNVRIVASDFFNTSGNKLASDHFSINPVGYVDIISPSAGFGVGYAGWWPDVILGFLSSIDINQGEYQPFFVSVYAPSNQAAGVYSGSFIVEAGNGASQTVQAEITIWNFALPDKPSMTSVLSLYEGNIRNIYSKFGGYDIGMKKKYYKFIMDYKISPDNIYAGAPEIAVLGDIKKNRWLGLACMGMPPHIWTSDYDTKLNDFFPKMKSRYDLFEQNGLLQNAYIYAFDEVGQEYKSKMQEVFRRIKQNFPDIPIMTTSVPIDKIDEYPNVDYFVDMYDPVFAIYKDTLLKNAREKGKKIFWYTSNYPGELNFSIENPLINIRILMGADAAKYRPDGFLFWAITRWTIPPSKNDHPIQSGPYTDWDPQSLENYNGSGSWFYPGPTGPISSLRLEAYRDGVEDYEYYILLEKLIKEKQDTAQPDLISEARKILQVNSNVVGNTNASSFTHDPRVLYNERNKIALTILALKGINVKFDPDVNPPAAPTGLKIHKN